ncbi:hypothetical protein PACTADRAFT_46912 [Pachysolen tannophilus NRRL Y-2460]|uniref:U three protein 23 n=1 Tax=Pachysolen tannophilus NRRL Y-2460 TaxID=669874 RepID=A0A1E4TP08_PACTA|nr:hypothetical protein PACTADRAFT_46912 [Pachysolen tannophilus NRRL Y-2460]
MRQKRAKAYRKQINVYVHTFKFRAPFQTIVDAELVLHCDKTSFDLQKGLDRTIQAEVKPMITQCCMQELYKSRNQRAIDYAKSFERRRCNHPPSDPLSSTECIKSIVDIKGENKHRYIVATQLDELRRYLRKIPGVPLVYMNRSVMVMEPLSQASLKIEKIVEKRKLTKGLNDAKYAGLPHNEDEEKINIIKMEGEKPTVSKKRKISKEPNPLSVKKKKANKPEHNAETNINNNSNNKDDKTEDGKTKKRKRHHGKHKITTINQDIEISDRQAENLSTQDKVQDNE